MPKVTKPFLDISKLHELFTVDAFGNLIRIKPTLGKDGYVGAIAGHVGGNGRRIVGVCGRQVHAHQIVWAMTNGKWPTHEIDHINGNPGDNRPANLRLCDTSQNHFNKTVAKRSKSGLKNVSYRKDRRCWVVQVYAYKKAHVVHGFHSKEIAGDFAWLLRNLLHGDFAHD